MLQCPIQPSRFCSATLRVVLATLMLTALVSATPSTARAQKTKQEQPNILLILTDQQFADVMGAAGSKWVKTPGMDAIAARGVRFTNAYVNYPVCLPSRYSMMTGRLPCTRRQADAANKPTISLGNQARNAGYTTAYYGKWHVQDRTFARDDTQHSGYEHEGGGNDITMTDRALSFLKEHRKEREGKPFFAAVSYYNPHDICEWARKKAGHTQGIRMRNGEVDINPPLSICPPLPPNFAINADEAQAAQERRKGSKKGKPNAQNLAMGFTTDQWRQYRWAYHRMVELADKQIVRLLKSLKENGYADNTVIIFTSDHGDGYGAHQWHQKSILYEESCRVPFIVSLPNATRKNDTDDRLISTGIDLIATVSELAGSPMPQGPYYGKSAVPLARSTDPSAPTHDYVVTEAEVTSNSGDYYQGRSVRTPQFKYHAWDLGADREQLFDMIKDPGETHNLAADPQYAAVIDQHRDLLAQWLANTDDTYRMVPASQTTH